MASCLAPGAGLRRTRGVAMKQFCILLLCLSASAAFAADFRALNIGDSCENVVAQETNLGSTLTKEDPEGPKYFFIASLFDRVVTVVYWCSETVLFRGSYLFEHTDYRDARALYARAKANLTRTFGAPVHDEESEEFRNKLRERGLLAKEQAYAAIWQTQDLTVHSSLYGPAGGEGWRVALSYQATE
jgi:hypothetical protein